jgi:hypothetical protein
VQKARRKQSVFVQIWVKWSSKHCTWVLLTGKTSAIVARSLAGTRTHFAVSWWFQVQKVAETSGGWVNKCRKSGGDKWWLGEQVQGVADTSDCDRINWEPTQNY